MLSDRIRVDTPYPCPPELLVEQLVGLRDQLPEHDRATVGFPGLVRGGRVVYTAAFVRDSYGGDVDDGLVRKWTGFALADALGERFGVPTKVANDADVQGCAVAEGNGFELVLTLGTGVGAALFNDGRLLPHLELGHAPFSDGGTFEDQLGNVARKQVGNRTWRATRARGDPGVPPVPVLRPDPHRRRERQAPERRRPPGERAHRPEHRGHQRRRPDLGPRHVTTA